ncbi:hypothetical protein F909_03257 [Acinetobacter sp. ANC 3929]|uniref:putative molybdenum carrier protein n=1 Tax=unclassified Acinetobacter TaxID=196816 RepID=UPI0002CFB1F0|nr:MULTISPECIES: putative molybdenum carrier protein [unclassified Acinetobacter]ENW78940.1 hypothetical protein F909_03257 [Acinetobacter sp. ANC 3929]MCH7352519.1 putative molybdenum carrier protein [Acinetobacter sp. NIPH 2023]MCH7356367.1 putative molybdenum carrier protein [Acinetobacter sp. NIPH 1958]MCH7359912.1 putative molybdenum carrier protein [Acinetobacter sp. NIPH 2024]
MKIKIISGGQTGVDRGALDAALSVGAPCGGWCPEGRMAEDGVIPDRYPLSILENSGYRKRTKQNVQDSDATIIIYFDYIFAKGGTELTLLECIKAKKPYLLIDGSELSVARAAERVYLFYEKNKILTLNVAGPKGSSLPQAKPYTEQVITSVLKRIID